MRGWLRCMWLLAVGCMVGCTPAWARFEPVTCHNPFTQQQEIDEGQKIALKVYQQMPVLPENDPVTVYVRHIGARLMQAAPNTPGLAQQWPFSFHVVASSEVNAFALPGGATFVNLGAVQAAETEAQLAGVMAHEMSHVILRHSTCNMTQQEHRSILYSLGQMGSDIFLGNGAAGSLASLGLGMGEKLDFLHMSRGDEKQADLLGVNILDAAGYDPRGLAQFFEIIRAKSGPGGTQFLSDHPNPGNRTQYVEAEISSLPPRTADTTINTSEYKRIHAIAMSERSFTGTQVADGAWKQVGGYIQRPGMSVGSARGSGAYAQAGSSAQTEGSARTAGSAQAAPPALSPLSVRQLGLNDQFTVYQASRWSIAAPSGWTRVQDRAPSQSGRQTGGDSTPADSAPAYDGNGQATANHHAQVAPTPGVLIAPPGGSGSFGIAYGVMISIAQVDGNGIQNQAQLANAASQLVQNLIASQTGLTQSGGMSSFQVAGQSAESVDLSGVSPVRGKGQSANEHDWVVTVARPDGDVNMLIFVAPQDQFAQMKPTFERMLGSFQPQ
jgi:predicted Zn-dependent protease